MGKAMVNMGSDKEHQDNKKTMIKNKIIQIRRYYPIINCYCVFTYCLKD